MPCLLQQRDSYDEYMDGSNWRQVLFHYEEIVRPALLAEGGAGVPEADLLFTSLRDIMVVCSKTRETLKTHHILRCKLSAFAFARTMEALVASCYFTARPINLYFTWLSVYLPYTIGLDRSKGQVVPSECSTQFQESRWAHLRALHHRGNRGGGVTTDGIKGRAFLLTAVADDQCHLIYVPEYGLHDDRHTTPDQSVLTKVERRAERDGDTVSFHLNMMIPQWVLEQDGWEEDWKRFQKLFLTGFTEGHDYHKIDAGDDAGIVACTAENARHRQCGTMHRSAVRAHVHRLPAAKSIATSVKKRVRLVIAPEQVDRGGEQVANGVAVLVFRTEITDVLTNGENDVTVPHPATETVKPVKKEQLLQLVGEYRERYDPNNAAKHPELNTMTVDAKHHGSQRSLRCELWDWFDAKGWLPNDLLAQIFASELGTFEWVPVQRIPAAPTRAAPQPTARGWRAIWTAWGWGYSNGEGAVQLVDPGTTRADNAGQVNAPAASDEHRERFQQPAVAHRVAASQEGDE